MRAAPYPPDDMPADLLPLHNKMAAFTTDHLKGFASQRPDGALIGPFAAMLRFPAFGRAAWTLTKALIDHGSLPKPAREVAILATGAVFNARYELDAHEQSAEESGLSPAKIAGISAGQRPADLTEAEQAAYDVATVLASGRPLPQSTYERALREFGEEQTAELVYLVGAHCLVSLLQNAYDVAVSGRDEGGAST
jgi:alkylhydroperoxidase family enzyme